MNSLESEMKAIIVDNGVGFHNNPGDAEALARHIEWCYEHPDELALMQRKAVTFTADWGDAPKVYARTIEQLELLSQNQRA